MARVKKPKSVFLDRLRELAAEDGWKLRKTKLRLERAGAHGDERVALTLSVYSPWMHIRVALQMRIDETQKLVDDALGAPNPNAWMVSLQPKPEAYLPHGGGSIRVFIGDTATLPPDVADVVDPEDELRQAAERTMGVIRRSSGPFFAEHRDLAATAALVEAADVDALSRLAGFHALIYWLGFAWSRSPEQGRRLSEAIRARFPDYADFHAQMARVEAALGGEAAADLAAANEPSRELIVVAGDGSAPYLSVATAARIAEGRVGADAQVTEDTSGPLRVLTIRASQIIEVEHLAARQAEARALPETWTQARILDFGEVPHARRVGRRGDRLFVDAAPAVYGTDGRVRHAVEHDLSFARWCLPDDGRLALVGHHQAHVLSPEDLSPIWSTPIAKASAGPLPLNIATSHADGGWTFGHGGGYGKCTLTTFDAAGRQQNEVTLPRGGVPYAHDPASDGHLVYQPKKGLLTRYDRALEAQPLPGGHKDLHRIALDPTGRWLAYAKMMTNTAWVRRRDGGEERAVKVHPFGKRYPWTKKDLHFVVHQLFFSPNGRFLAIAGGRYRLVVVDLETGDERALAGHLPVVDTFYAGIEHACFSGDGSRLLTGATDGEVRVWDTSSGECVGRLVGHTGAVEWIDAAPDLGTVVTAARDETVRIWQRA